MEKEEKYQSSDENITYTPNVKLSDWWNGHVLGSACYGHTNLVPAFCRAYTKKTGREVVAVHTAKGSTEISWWLPQTVGFDAIVSKGSAAIRKARALAEVGHIYFVWLQGESDAISGRSKDYYKEKLKELFGGLSDSLSVERFCIIRVGRFTNDERDGEIIDAQSEICREDENFLMLTEIATELNLDSVMMNPYVAGHFSAAGLEALGTAAGKSLAEFVLEN